MTLGEIKAAMHMEPDYRVKTPRNMNAMSSLAMSSNSRFMPIPPGMDDQARPISIKVDMTNHGRPFFINVDNVSFLGAFCGIQFSDTRAVIHDKLLGAAKDKSRNDSPRGECAGL